MEYPIRVLCVFSTLDRGGAESMCMNLYRHIDRDKVQFDFVKHTKAKGAFEDEIAFLGGRVYEAPRFTGTNIISYVNWWKKHFAHHSEHTIIHGHFFTISAVYFSVAQRKNRITVGHIHASAVNGFLQTAMVKMIRRVTDYPLACSQQAGHWIYGNRPFTVLNNGLDSDQFRYGPETRQRVRQQLGLGDAFTLGTVANFSSVKNPMGLIDIFLSVNAQRPDTKLIWVGEGTERKNIEERIRTENLTKKVLLLGTRNDVPDILQAMDAFLLPSFSEGLPVSAIEAQATGLPCYISNTVSHEVDITGLCRFLPINKPEAWTDAIFHETAIREDASAKIKTAGYDINDTSLWLQDFYLEIAKRGK